MSIRHDNLDRLLGVKTDKLAPMGGTTKEYEVEVDLNKLDAYNVTIPR